MHSGRFSPSSLRKTSAADRGRRGFRSLRVLVADDSGVERRVVASILERRGHRVTVAADGEEALTLFRKKPFDAAVLDLQMPGIDGEALAALLRERLRRLEKAAESQGDTPAFRIVAVSGTLPERDEGGIDCYLAKPIDPDRLAAAVEGEAARAPDPEPEEAAGTGTGTEAGAGAGALGERVVFDLGEALTRARGKRPLLAELVRIFLEDASVQMSALKAALDAGDLEKIERSAHRLKGSAMNVSAQRTADAAGQIEQGVRAGRAAEALACWERLEAEVGRARKALGGFLAQNDGAGAAAGFGLAPGTARLSPFPPGPAFPP